MTEGQLVVYDDLVVSLDYTLRLDDGEIVDSSAEQEPLQFLQGHGQVLPALESALYGMAIGEEKDVVVGPDEGYGELDPDAFQQLPLDAFPPDMAVEPGMVLELLDDTGETLVAFVAEVRPDNVVLDFNHPLAGETLYFYLKVAGLRRATGEELAHGHVHGLGDEHR
jgi:FKBP-type peptidyl-prolyl cis-trans isomerase SlyD